MLALAVAEHEPPILHAGDRGHLEILDQLDARGLPGRRPERLVHLAPPAGEAERLPGLVVEVERRRGERVVDEADAALEGRVMERDAAGFHADGRELVDEAQLL